MRKFATIAAASMLAMGLAACDSGAENAMEEEAVAVDEAAEAQADSMREMADGTATEEAVDEQADAVEAAGEEKKDAMEDAADNMDAAPQ